MAKGFTYKSYSFVDKDPIIDEVRTIVQLSGATYKKIEEDSGVTSKTLRDWFDGQTRKPQAATLNAVARALGYKLGFVPYEVVSIVQPVSAADPGPALRHAVRMAKIRRVK
jgi:hypothetical protein